MSSSFFTIPPKEEWAPLDKVKHCAVCGRGFERRGQHCPGCGRACCPSCLCRTATLPGHMDATPTAVCEACYVKVQRVYEEVDSVLLRCTVLEQTLNEQCVRSEELIAESRELRLANDSLREEKTQLEGKVKRLEVELEVAAAKASLASHTAAAATPPPEPEEVSIDPTTLTPEEEKEMTALEKKKKLLDIRESTLQESLKKVSKDAAKLVSQRNALLEQEKNLQETLTTDFVNFFEKERDRMEKLFFAQISTMASNFTRLVKEQRLFSSPEKQHYEKELAAIRKEFEEKMRDLNAKSDRVEELEKAVEDLQSVNTSLCRTEPSTPIPTSNSFETEIDQLRTDLQKQLTECQQEWALERRAMTMELQEAQHALAQEVERVSQLKLELQSSKEQRRQREAQLTEELELTKETAAKELAHVKQQQEAAVADLNRRHEEEKSKEREEQKRQFDVMLEEEKKKLQASVDATAAAAAAKKEEEEEAKIPTPVRSPPPEATTPETNSRKELKRMEAQLKENILFSMGQKRTITALQAEIETLKASNSRLQNDVKASRRRSSVMVTAPSREREAAPAAPAVAVDLEPFWKWYRQRLGLLEEYTSRRSLLTLEEPMAVVRVTLQTIAEEVETHRQASHRQAISLERTTSTMKMLQEDFKIKDEQLKERERETARKEAQLKEMEQLLLQKKTHIMQAAQNLREVSVRLREQEKSLER